MRKIGIAITTMNRPDHLRFCWDQIVKHTNDSKTPNGNYGFCTDGIRQWFYDKQSNPVYYYFAKDIPNVAHAKNMCLYHLRDCDYIFLFDDDCWPKKHGWEKFFIDSGMDHLLYLNRSHQKQFEYALPNGQILESYKECGGVFMMVTKKAFEKVGYLNSRYVGYGYEHAGYSQRIHLAGLNPSPFVQLKGTKDYLHSLDYDGYGDYSHLPQKSSISDAEKQKNLGDNWQIYLQERGNFFNFYKDFRG